MEHSLCYPEQQPGDSEEAFARGFTQDPIRRFPSDIETAEQYKRREFIRTMRQYGPYDYRKYLLTGTLPHGIIFHGDPRDLLLKDSLESLFETTAKETDTSSKPPEPVEDHAITAAQVAEPPAAEAAVPVLEAAIDTSAITEEPISEPPLPVTYYSTRARTGFETDREIIRRIERGETLHGSRIG